MVIAEVWTRSSSGYMHQWPSEGWEADDIWRHRKPSTRSRRGTRPGREKSSTAILAHCQGVFPVDPVRLHARPRDKGPPSGLRREKSTRALHFPSHDLGVFVNRDTRQWRPLGCFNLPSPSPQSRLTVVNPAQMSARAREGPGQWAAAVLLSFRGIEV